MLSLIKWGLIIMSPVHTVVFSTGLPPLHRKHLQNVIIPSFGAGLSIAKTSLWGGGRRAGAQAPGTLAGQARVRLREFQGVGVKGFSHEGSAGAIRKSEQAEDLCANSLFSNLFNSGSEHISTNFLSSLYTPHVSVALCS